ncbi:MAG: hypothetical protein PHF44_04245 [Candidatus Pacebacteria bacterium]|nr:hypothetical protein [Candidatus Paceibacterota bacterium]
MKGWRFVGFCLMVIGILEAVFNIRANESATTLIVGGLIVLLILDVGLKILDAISKLKKER